MRLAPDAQLIDFPVGRNSTKIEIRLPEIPNFLAPLAQLAEQVTLNHWVAGSIPARCKISLIQL